MADIRDPDHIHIQQTTVSAFEKSDDALIHLENALPFKSAGIYIHVFPHKFLRFVTRLMPIVAVNPL